MQYSNRDKDLTNEAAEKGSLHLIYVIQISFETTHFLFSFFFKFNSPLSGFSLVGR